MSVITRLVCYWLLPFPETHARRTFFRVSARNRQYEQQNKNRQHAH